MPSSIEFTPTTRSKPRLSSIYTRPQKKQKMTLSQTYFLAHSARGKLSKQASRADHDLRLLVGHANMLDSLMLDLASAEREQEQWFNNSLSLSEEAVEDPEPDWEAEDADESGSDSDYDDEENIITASTEATAITTTEADEKEEDFEDDEEDYSNLVLTRTASRHAPPELSSDSDSDSEDEQMPPSPPSTTFDSFTEHRRQAIANPPKDPSLSRSQQEAFIKEGFFLPARPQQSSSNHQPLREHPSMIAAF